MLTTLLSLSTLVPMPQDRPGATLLAAPLAFEAQVQGGRDAFAARGPGYSIAVDAQGSTLRLLQQSGRFDLHTAFAGASPAARITGEEPTPRVVNYYLGNDPSQWRERVATFARARCRAVWPGVDVVFYGQGGELEYDFVVAPGADPACIRMRIEGHAAAAVATDGDLVLSTPGGELRHRAPVAYQVVEGSRVAVDARYEIGEDGTIGFTLGDHDSSSELVIDPILVYLGLLDGASSDQQARIAVDGQGQAVIAFQTASANLPTRNPIQPTPGSLTDLFVARFTADGSNLVYATYLGGAAADNPGGVAMLPGGEVVIGCRTGSRDYPLRNAAFPVFNGVIAAGVTVLSPTGALVWSTYYCKAVGTSDTGCSDVATGPNGDIVICGRTTSLDNPVHASPFQAQRAGTIDAFAAGFNSQGQFRGATYFGRPGTNRVAEAFDVAVAANGRVLIGGHARADSIPVRNGFQAAHGGGTNDAFLAVFDPTLSLLDYSTYAGGSLEEASASAILEPLGVAFDPQGRAVLASHTTSTNFPVTANAFDRTFGGVLDGFVLKVDPALAGAASLLYSTYVGAAGNDGLTDVAIDAAGNYYLSGHTNSSTGVPFVLPLMPPSGNPVAADGLLAVLDADGQTLRFCTPIGRQVVFNSGLSCEGVAAGPNNTLYFGGSGLAVNVPVTPNAFKTPATTTSGGFAGRIDLTFAAATSYGQGHPGTSGVPALASDPPVLGKAIDIRIGNSLGAPTPGVLLVGTAAANLPTPFGGTLLVGGFFPVSLTIPGNGATLRVAIPADLSASGSSVFLQVVEFDPGASHQLSFSRGLRETLGI
jgi:hypothetical protein